MKSRWYRATVDGAVYVLLTSLTFIFSILYYGWVTTTVIAVGMIIFLVNVLPVVRAAAVKGRPDRGNDLRWAVLLMVAMLVVMPQILKPGR
jgi:hypothetical protein